MYYICVTKAKNMNNTPSVYEIKIGRKWTKVRATSMIALSSWAESNNVSEWRMVGMQSISELLNNQNIQIVA